MWPLNTGGCLKEVTTWARMPGFQFFGHEKSRKFSLKQLRKVFNFCRLIKKNWKDNYLNKKQRGSQKFVFWCDQDFLYFCKMGTFSCQLGRIVLNLSNLNEDCRGWASYFKMCAILMMSTFNEKGQFKIRIGWQEKTNGVRILYIGDNLVHIVVPVWSQDLDLTSPTWLCLCKARTWN